MQPNIPGRVGATLRENHHFEAKKKSERQLFRNREAGYTLISNHA
jgi:hypothetical protein